MRLERVIPLALCACPVASAEPAWDAAVDAWSRGRELGPTRVGLVARELDADGQLLSETTLESDWVWSNGAPTSTIRWARRDGVDVTEELRRRPPPPTDPRYQVVPFDPDVAGRLTTRPLDADRTDYTVVVDRRLTATGTVRWVDGRPTSAEQTFDHLPFPVTALHTTLTFGAGPGDTLVTSGVVVRGTTAVFGWMRRGFEVRVSFSDFAPVDPTAH
jgi:hypothetical protein